MGDIDLDVKTNLPEADQVIKEQFLSYFRAEKRSWSLLFSDDVNFTSQSNIFLDLNQNGTYHVKGNKLFLKIDDDSEEDYVTIQSLNMHELVISENIKDALSEGIEEVSGINEIPENLVIKKAILKITFDRTFAEDK